MTSIPHDNVDEENDDDVQMTLKAIREKSTLPDEYKIPTKAWQLLTKIISKEDRDAFIAERSKVLSESGTTLGIPKQYGGVGSDDNTPRKTNLSTTKHDHNEWDSDDSDTSHEDDLVHLLRSYKASQNASRFLGMAKTTPMH
jgi:hypothetical protein